MPESFGAGGLIAGFFGNAAGNVAAGPLNAFTIAGNFIAPTGFITWEQGNFLKCLDSITDEQWHNLRRIHGMIGDNLTIGDIIITTVNADGKSAFKPAGISGPNLINDIWISVNKPWPTNDELNLMFNRRYITESFYRQCMLLNAQGEPGIANAQSLLRYNIPGPSDLIHFAVRDCFDPQVVSTFQYNKELPIAILPFMEANGYHGNLGLPLPQGSTTTQGIDQRQFAQWFDMYWWSHWQLPSPTQGFEMLHRMYLVSPFGPAPGINANNHFDVNALRLLLKANDYPIYWRDKLEFISYSPLTRVDVRRMYDIGVIGEAEIYHSYRAIGYNDVNAQHLVRFTVELAIQRELKPIKQLIYKETHELFLMGAILAPQVRANLTQIRMKDSTITATIRAWELEIRRKELKTLLAVLKSGFMLGGYDRNDVRIAMQRLDMPNESITYWLQLWEYEKYGRRKFMSAEQNLQMYMNRMITQNQLRRKLMNLNFDGDEINEMIKIANAKVEIAIGKQVEKRIKAEQQRQKESLKKLLAPYTDSHIRKSFEKGTLTATEIFHILRLRGWTKSASLQWMETQLEIEPEEIDTTESEEIETEESEGENAEQN